MAQHLFTSALAEALAPGLLERFGRYVRIDTQSRREQIGSPSTPGQLELGGGGHEYHSVREWASLQEMAAAAATIVHLAGVWSEPEYAESAPPTARTGAPGAPA